MDRTRAAIQKAAASEGTTAERLAAVMTAVIGAFADEREFAHRHDLILVNREMVTTGPRNTVAETNIFTYTIPGGFLTTKGELRLFILVIAKENSAVTHTLKVYLGATTLFSLTIDVDASERKGIIEVLLAADDSQAAQHAILMTKDPDPASGADYNFSGHATATEDLSSDVVLKATVTLGEAHANTYLESHWATLSRVLAP